MSENIEQRPLISHSIDPQSIDITIKHIADRIRQQGDKPYATVNYQLELLKQLSEFAFGRFLLANQGINGYWTHYMLTHPWFGRKTRESAPGIPLTELEAFILDKAPLMLATQERFEIFLQKNQMAVKDNAVLACIPCGMMGELLYLDFKKINHIELIGFDYDPMTLNDASILAKQQGLESYVQLEQGNAWELNLENKLDLISSNGLTIYEPDDKQVVKLFDKFYSALKPGGKLVTSFITYPISLTEQCEWDMSQINQKDLLLQKIIFADILEAKFQCFRSSAQTKQQLESVGFTNIEFIYDKAKMFPTVLAYK
ncbi:SAM-dependent methyltransferase [Legionella fallonii]|uniref:Methyltransferase domain-containing protein n=1 Tax=Legionella fallonii LLAP-10 TaxID=1212491 RepID=A0A098G965_9GAMM|nr:class I SAM-dependent methyltransferase [Legionella fallonii]CEG58005.1 conserved protein of unknown function [Legionella fallonii LLAP-10]